MPCWTVRETSVDIDAEGMDIERLKKAAKEHGFVIRIVDGSIEVVDRLKRPKETVMSMIKRSYATLTVQDGMKRFGFKTKKVSEERQTGIGRVTKLRLGR